MAELTEHIKDVCKIGQGADCCKYLLAGAEGLECGKIEEGWKNLIDQKWATEEHVAQGDNCEGKDKLS